MNPRPQLDDPTEDAPLKIHTEHRDHLAIVRPVGRFAGSNLDFMLRDAVAAVIAAGSRHVVVDLADLPRIDSSGIGELVSAYAAARNRGATLEFARLSPMVAEVLATSQLRSIVTVHDTLDSALASAGGSDAEAAGRLS